MRRRRKIVAHERPAGVAEFGLGPLTQLPPSTHVTVRSVKVTCREEPTCLAVMYDARQTADMAGDDRDAGSQRFERSHRQSLGARRHHEQTERRPVRREVRDEAVKRNHVTITLFEFTPHRAVAENVPA